MLWRTDEKRITEASTTYTNGGDIMKKLLRLAIKYGPIVYPMVKKFINKRKRKNGQV